MVQFVLQVYPGFLVLDDCVGTEHVKKTGPILKLILDVVLLVYDL